MEHIESSFGIFEKFAWKIENFSRLKNTKKLYSEPFVLGGYPWRILLFPKGNKVENDLSIYLVAVETANMSKGWSRDVKFKMVVFNQLNHKHIITKELDHEFNATENDWGHVSFMTLIELRDPKKGFIVKDTCIVGAEVFVYKSAHEKRVTKVVNLTTSLTFGCQTGHMENQILRPEPKDAEPTRDANMFAALGRDLYFLKTRKVKDMNNQACKELQVLWEELKKFRFVFTWLEPHVQYALGMKNYVKKALQVEKLKENMVVLELELDRLKKRLVAAELNLDVERDLLKAKDFKETNLDSELECGSWRP